MNKVNDISWHKLNETVEPQVGDMVLLKLKEGHSIYDLAYVAVEVGSANRYLQDAYARILHFTIAKPASKFVFYGDIDTFTYNDIDEWALIFRPERGEGSKIDINRLSEESIEDDQYETQSATIKRACPVWSLL